MSRTLIVIGSTLALALVIGCQSPHSSALTDGRESPTQTAAALPAKKGAGKLKSNTHSGGLEDVGSFETWGEYETLDGVVWISAFNSSDRYTASAEVAVASGTVRVYLAVGNPKAIHLSADQGGYRYAEASPGKPVKVSGELVVGYGAFLESVGGAASGVRYRLWR